jgi:hypothetical protein
MIQSLNLPVAQDRSLSAAAWIMQEALEEMQIVLSDPTRVRTGRQIREDIDEVTRCQMLEALEQLRNANDEMFQNLHLKPDVLSQAQVVRSRAAHAWTVLENCKSSALYSSSLLPKQTEAIVEHLDRLLGIISKLR